ncbi:MAG: flavodoxin [Aristaeellaceae bacterium]
MAKLIVYFSRSGENYVSGTIRHLTVGNTEVAARTLQELTGAELFRLEPLVRYSDRYNTCIAEAQDDQSRDARPELAKYPDSLDGYDTIYLGYPNYWGTMPMCVFTFLEYFDWAGKTILPFCTHEGSGMGRSETDIRRLCPGAAIGNGLAIQGAEVQRARSRMAAWVRQNA